MTIFSSFAVAALLAVQTGEPRFAADPPEQVVPRLEAAFDALQAQGFSGYVAVTHEGEIVFERGYGAANPQSGAPFTRDTRIDMGSVVKTHTGLMAAQLIEDGVLDPDMTLGQVFENVPEDKTDITLHQLLTHSAGMPGAVASDDEPIDRDEFLRRAFAAPLRYEPGTAYQYSNTGFSLAAAIIETVTGRRYEDILLDDFLLPAGIEQTGYDRSYDMAQPPADMAFTADGQALHEVAWGGHAPGWALFGNGAMFTTIGEMIDWRAAIHAGELFTPTALERAQTPYVREGANAPSWYGYGTVIENSPDFGRIHWHNGGNGYESAYWGEYADADYAIFVATNQLEIDGDHAAMAATGAIFGVELQMSGPPDGDWDDVDLEAGPRTRLVGEFLTMIRSGSDEPRRAFVETRMIDGLRDVAPMEGHLSMFDEVAAMIGDREPAGMQITEETVLLRYDGSPPLVLEIGVELDGETAVMTGLGLTD